MTPVMNSKSSVMDRDIPITHDSTTKVSKNVSNNDRELFVASKKIQFNVVLNVINRNVKPLTNPFNSRFTRFKIKVYLINASGLNLMICPRAHFTSA